MKNFTNALVKNVLVPIILVAFAVVFLFLGITSISHQKNYIKTTATITDIYSTMVGDDETYHTVVKYTVDGEQYENEMTEYAASYKVGKEIDVIYNPENPNEVESASLVFVIVEMAIGIITGLIALFMIFRLLFAGALILKG